MTSHDSPNPPDRPDPGAYLDEKYVELLTDYTRFCGRYVLHTPSGHRFNSVVSGDSVSVEDIDRRQFSFSASIETYEAGTNPPAGRALGFSAHTIHHRLGGLLKRRHPDMFAAKLLEGAITYFDAQQPITDLKGGWKLAPNHDTNYKMFYRALRGIREPTQEDLHRAAFATWTGQQALKHDFTTISKLDTYPDQRYVAVRFTRPAAPATTDV